MNLPPGDVIFQILLMLPVRSLLRFRCVCKEWCTLTKSSLFEDTHLALQRATSRNDEFIVYKQRRPIIYSEDDYNDSVICCNGDYESLALSVSFASFDRFEIPGDFIGPVRIVNHVNGIICVYGIKRFSVILVNPALREVKKLPVPAGLGFTWYIQTFGFGWDDTTNDYKVVGLLKSRCVPRSYKAIIYRLCTDSWTILGEMPAFFLGRAFGRRILFHGSIHWLMDGNDEGRISTSKDDCQILTFNMTTELFQVIDFPSGWKDYDYESCSRQLFVVERSNIALVAFTNPILLDVWVMKDYGVTESWSKRYSIKPFLEIEWLISFWGKDKLLFKARDGKLNCYDLSKGEIYQPLHQKPVRLSRVDIITGHESLVSIK